MLGEDLVDVPTALDTKSSMTAYLRESNIQSVYLVASHRTQMVQEHLLSSRRPLLCCIHRQKRQTVTCSQTALYRG